MSAALAFFESCSLPGLRSFVLACASVCAAALFHGCLEDLAPDWLGRLAHHERTLDARLRYLRVGVPARWLVIAECALCVLAVVCVVSEHYALIAVCIAPLLVLKPALELACSKRTQHIEAQLDHWLSGLAATLRVSPSLGQALDYSCGLVSAPLRDELVTMVSEMALGIAVDEALERMGQRIGSRTVRSAVGTLRVGRNTGGALPELLERSAGVLREMARLEGVFRTKTAEGRAQASVVSVMPFAMLGLLHSIDPPFIAPLFETTRGHLVLAAAGVLWVAQIFVARKILHVDY